MYQTLSIWDINVYITLRCRGTWRSEDEDDDDQVPMVQVFFPRCELPEDSIFEVSPKVCVEFVDETHRNL